MKKPITVKRSISDSAQNLRIVQERLHERYKERCVSMFEGRNRRVYVMRNGYVVKVPLNLGGITDNDWEGSVSPASQISSDWQIQYPKTRLFHVEEIPIVLMEFVEFAGEDKIVERFGRFPNWVYRIDGGQVGFNRLGRLVAFDFGPR